MNTVINMQRDIIMANINKLITNSLTVLYSALFSVSYISLVRYIYYLYKYEEFISQDRGDLLSRLNFMSNIAVSLALLFLLPLLLLIRCRYRFLNKKIIVIFYFILIALSFHNYHIIISKQISKEIAALLLIFCFSILEFYRWKRQDKIQNDVE
jgi:hypothetical protein